MDGRSTLFYEKENRSNEGNRKGIEMTIKEYLIKELGADDQLIESIERFHSDFDFNMVQAGHIDNKALTLEDEMPGEGRYFWAYGGDESKSIIIGSTEMNLLEVFDFNKWLSEAKDLPEKEGFNEMENKIFEGAAIMKFLDDVRAKLNHYDRRYMFFDIDWSYIQAAYKLIHFPKNETDENPWKYQGSIANTFFHLHPYERDESWYRRFSK